MIHPPSPSSGLIRKRNDVHNHLLRVDVGGEDGGFYEFLRLQIHPRTLPIRLLLT
jgi:hypothetical protein